MKSRRPNAARRHGCEPLAHAPEPMSFFGAFGAGSDEEDEQRKPSSLPPDNVPEADEDLLPEPPQLPDDDDLWEQELNRPMPDDRREEPLNGLKSLEFDEDNEPEKPSQKQQTPARRNHETSSAPAKKPWALVDHFISDKPPKQPFTDDLQQFIVEDEPESLAEPEERHLAPEVASNTAAIDRSREDSEATEAEIVFLEETGDHLFEETVDLYAKPLVPHRDAPVERAAIREEDDHFVVEEVGQSFPDPEIPMVAGWDPQARVVVYCNEHAYRVMFKHAHSGLPRAEGGKQPPGAGAFEVKGVLLGSVLWLEERIIVLISEALALPASPMDRNDRCSYGPVEDDLVRRHLAERRYLGVVGYYHSHPDHPIFLSVFDVQTLNRRCVPEWCIAVVVQPRERRLGFFIKQQRGEQTAFFGNQKPLVYIPLT